MTQIDKTGLSFDEFDELHFPRPEENEFDRVVERAISRRGFLGSVLAFGSGAAAMGTGLLSSTSAKWSTPGSPARSYQGSFQLSGIDVEVDRKEQG